MPRCFVGHRTRCLANKSDQGTAEAAGERSQRGQPFSFLYDWSRRILVVASNQCSLLQVFTLDMLEIRLASPIPPSTISILKRIFLC